MSINVIVLQGRFTRDPELRYTQNQKPVATFALAVDRDYASPGEKREADFIECVAWNKTAEFVHQYFTKGSPAIVTGRLQMRQWTDKNEQKRVSAEVIVDRISFAGDKKDNKPAEGNTFTDLNDTGGELPF